MSWKPPPASAERLRAKLDDEFETVAKPQGLRRTSDVRREQEAESGDAPDSWSRSSEAGSARRVRRAAAAEDGPDADGQARKGPSLKMRAVGYLSRREHAREELARKLAAHAEDPAEVEAVLDALEKEGWLSTERFAQSLVHRRASRQGAARIVQELRQHGVDDNQVAELREQLRATEYDRALEVWKKRFSAKPEDRAAYAKQARFLASRGFAHDVIRRILGESDGD
ncbi:Regulatory protein recX [Achromobacter insolitus]|uniref:recombination regulator RecX n=1 Tax=Achromobacter insolitus TaxID=217204 RepID=UPI000B51895B|nr:recombination regulator RecX [Achromobacter insolitus]OWT64515.1 recombination regulator RecX [Achromobacter insolitus]CAB3709253.1 Regulatory protein RecX [Achromobacter insolitus]VEG70355.1 Regulatory protein recX [Achromobacter insolitus]